jgi:putative membrane protein
MKAVYKVVGLFVACALIVGCASRLSYQEALNKNQRKIESTDKLDDAKFLVEAKSINILERELNQSATTAGYAATLVQLAKKNLEDHKNMDKELNKLASKKKIKLPTIMKEEHTALHNELATLAKQDFDKAFIKDLKQINEDNTFKFENMATEAHDADIRAFSARKLDMMRAHAKRLEEVEKELLQTY